MLSFNKKTPVIVFPSFLDNPKSEWGRQMKKAALKIKNS
jgi:hypothetical protein